MAHFAYKGRDSAGKLVEGLLEGVSSGGVADVLLGRGITPVSINETRAPAKAAASAAVTIRRR